MRPCKIRIIACTVNTQDAQYCDKTRKERAVSCVALSHQVMTLNPVHPTGSHPESSNDTPQPRTRARPMLSTGYWYKLPAYCVASSDANRMLSTASV